MTTHAELISEHRNRRAAWLAKAVPDDGIDLRRPVGIVRIMPWATEDVIQAMQPYIERPEPVAPKETEITTTTPSPEKIVIPIAETTGAQTVEIIRSSNKKRVAQLVFMVGAHYDISTAAIYGDGRYNILVRPRHVAMYLARTVLKLSYPEIGRWIGSRDHTTVIAAVRRTESRMAADVAFGAEVRALAQRVLGEGGTV